MSGDKLRSPHVSWVFLQFAHIPIFGRGATLVGPLRPLRGHSAGSVGRWATSHRDVAAPKGEPSLASPLGGRWCPVGTVQRLVSAAASVGDGRSPLGCITRAGRRECPRRGRRGQPTSGPSPKQSLFALTYRPAVPYNHTTSWGSSLLGLPSGNVNTLANAWYCLKKRDSWKTSI